MDIAKLLIIGLTCLITVESV